MGGELVTIVDVISGRGASGLLGGDPSLDVAGSVVVVGDVGIVGEAIGEGCSDGLAGVRAASDAVLPKLLRLSEKCISPLPLPLPSQSSGTGTLALGT